jgi:hypothetical protein
MICGYARVSTDAQDLASQLASSTRPDAHDRARLAERRRRSIAEPVVDTTSDFAEWVLAVLAMLGVGRRVLSQSLSIEALRLPSVMVLAQKSRIHPRLSVQPVLARCWTLPWM